MMCDGVRPEQEYRATDYQKYKENLITKMLTEKDERNLIVLPFPEFQHQACMTIRTLFLVKTPLVLFVEADTPLVERRIDWDLLSNSLINGATNSVRLHYDEEIHEDHKHMMRFEEKILPQPDSPPFSGIIDRFLQRQTGLVSYLCITSVQTRGHLLRM